MTFHILIITAEVLTLCIPNCQCNLEFMQTYFIIDYFRLKGVGFNHRILIFCNRCIFKTFVCKMIPTAIILEIFGI